MGPEQDHRYFSLQRRAKQIDRFYRLSKEQKRWILRLLQCGRDQAG
jgi:hypothetical protein